MKVRRITEITIETDDTFTLRRSAGSSRVECSRCGSLAGEVTPSEAGALLRAGLPAIFDGIESGRLHARKTDSGATLICLDSLRNAASLLVPGNSILQIQTTFTKENPS